MNQVTAVVRAELFRSLRKRRIYVLAGLYWILLPALMLLLGRLLETNLRGSFVDESEIVGTLVRELASPFGIAQAALVGPALLSPTFYIIGVALLAGFLIGEERSHNTWKTVLTTQPNRLAVLSGKLIVGMILLGLLLAGAFIAGVLFGGIGTLFLDTDFSGAWSELARLFALQWLFTATALAFASLMIFVSRNVSLGMVLVFFLPALVEGLYGIYRATSRVQPLTRLNALFQALELRGALENLPRYFFTANLYAPARRPLVALVQLFDLDPGAGPDPLATLLSTDIGLAHAGLVMTGYGAAFLVLLAWLFLRRDVD
jgi:ABC-type transport system involved in multi-copper enzyme maturation permease subunit